MLTLMLYSGVVSLLLASAAAVAEWSFRSWELPTRWVWLSALAASLALPGLALLAGPAERREHTVGIPRLERMARQVPGAVLLPHAAASAGDGAVPWISRLERPLRAICLATPLVIGATLLISALTLGRRRKGWTPGTVGDTPVLISENLGPALVGLFHPAIVLPRWALDLEERMQRIMVAHEREHLAAGDSRLLAAGLGALTLMPWNLPLWWTVRRLRHAIELDCDARVLRGGADRRAYGALLLRVSQGPAPDYAIGIPLLGEPVSYLERRIRAMTRRIPKHAKLLAIGATGASAIILSAALVVPRPASAFGAVPGMSTAAATAPRMTGGIAASDQERRDGAGQLAASDTVTDAQVHAVLAERHPDLLRAPDPRVTLYVVANREGVVRKSLIVPLAQTHRAVLSRVPPRRSAHITPDGRAVVGDRSHEGEPRAYVAPGRDVFRELQAEFGADRISSLRMWSSHAVPGGVLVGWMTLQD